MTEKTYLLTEEEFETTLAAYCLGALTNDEAVAFEAHLESRQAQAALAAYQPTVEALALAAPIRIPPRAVCDRLLASLEPAKAPPARRLFWRRVSPWLAAAALFVLAVGLGARVWQQQRQITEYQTFLSSPLVVMMEAGDAAPKAQGRFYLAPDSRQGVLLVGDLPPLSPDKSYQLWLVDKNGARDDGGTFRVDPEGYGAYFVSAPKPMKEYIRIGVTTEPRGGSPGPTSGRIIGATLANAVPPN